YIKIHPESINDMDSSKLNGLAQYLNRITTNNTKSNNIELISQLSEYHYFSMHNQNIIELDSNVSMLREYMSGTHDKALVSAQYAMLPDQMVAPLVTLSHQIV
ncbi:hypothetical protein, partial [Yersinia alsatica]|uniref:hypothetical protein n=1 Tax=Yersinia alsatica TaxID=2890317 RepID=UPI001C94B235